jgi:hypothetical protein
MNFRHKNLSPEMLPCAGTGPYLGAFEVTVKIVF